MSKTVDHDDPLRCRCGNEPPCPMRATEEDMLCDTCRYPRHGHVSNPERTVVAPIRF